MAFSRGFPWRWVIAGLAIAVIVLTVLVPPPGTEQHAENPEVDQPEETNHAEVVETTALVSIPDTVRVLVLNGTEIDGLAGRTQRLLLRSSSDSTVILAPYDPTDTDAKPFKETILISHLPDISSALIIADILDRPENCIVWEVAAGDVPAPVDVTVCLGEDMVGIEIDTE